MQKICSLIAFAAAFGFLFLFQWGFHGYYLTDQYLATASLWRPEAEMNSHFPYMLISQLGTAVFFLLVFKKHCQKGGVAAGLKFGVLMGLLFAFMAFGAYAYMPIPLKLALHWAAGGFIEALGMGLIAGACCKPCSGKACL